MRPLIPSIGHRPLSILLVISLFISGYGLRAPVTRAGKPQKNITATIRITPRGPRVAGFYCASPMFSVWELGPTWNRPRLIGAVNTFIDVDRSQSEAFVSFDSALVGRDSRLIVRWETPIYDPDLLRVAASWQPAEHSFGIPCLGQALLDRQGAEAGWRGTWAHGGVVGDVQIASRHP